jgi:metallo-beta-lactamase family protein
MLGESVQLRARVQTINALSAHADFHGLMDWYDGIKKNVKHCFAVHGDEEKVSAMVDLLKEHGCPNAVAPMPGQTFEI